MNAQKTRGASFRRNALIGTVTAVAIAFGGTLVAAPANAVTVTVGASALKVGVPAITGHATVGKVLTVAPGTWTTGTAFTYQWFFANGDKVPSATARTLTVRPGQAGRSLYVVVKGTKSGYAAASKKSPTVGPVAKGALTSAQPAVSGTVQVGKALTAAPGSWTSGTAVHYQWYSGSSAISGATAKSYAIPASLVGATLRVNVTGSLAGYNDATRSSVSLGPVKAGALVKGTPSISGVAQVGKTLTAAPGDWTAGTAVVYQWYYGDGTAISGATAKTYVLATKDQNRYLYVKVTGSKAGYATAAATSAQTAQIKAAPVSIATVQITGTLQVGKSLSASAGTTTAGAKIAYQWYYGDGVKISGATASTIALTPTFVGRKMYMIETITPTGGSAITATSVKTAAVAPAALSSSTPTVGGSAKVGKSLTLSAGTWTAGTKLSYQWYYGDGTKISGATSAKLTFGPAAEGKSVYAIVTGTLAGYTTKSVKSVKVGPVAAGTISGAKPAISPTTPRVGDTISELPVKAGAWTSGITVAFQWYRIVGGKPVAISGATKPSYKVSSGCEGYQLELKVTGSKSGYTTLSEISAKTAKVAPKLKGASTGAW